MNSPGLNRFEAIGTDAIVAVNGTRIERLEPKTGKDLWASDLASNIPEAAASASGGLNVPFTILPPASGGSVWLVGLSRGRSGHIVALDAQTGRVLWDRGTDSATLKGSAPGSADTAGAVLSRPIVWHDRAVFRTGVLLTAVRLSDGATLWSVPMDSGGLVPLTPSADPVSDERAIYFNADFGTAFAFDPRNGRRLWATRTSGGSFTESAHVRKINISLCYCKPLAVTIEPHNLNASILKSAAAKADKSRILIADGLGDAYMLRSENGEVLWQAHGGYPYQFVSSGPELYAATDKGFFQLDPGTGVPLQQYQVSGGVVRCQIIGDVAILTHAILPNVPGGWEIFDLKQWKPLWHDPSFAVRYGLSDVNGLLFMSGYETASAGKLIPQIRAYKIQK